MERTEWILQCIQQVLLGGYACTDNTDTQESINNLLGVLEQARLHAAKADIKAYAVALGNFIELMDNTPCPIRDQGKWTQLQTQLISTTTSALLPELRQ
jgi:hypothetical protein